MRMKPKTARRLALLAGVFVLGAGAFVGLVLVRGAQNARIEASLREDGMAAHDAGDDAAALLTLGRYLRRVPDDADALLAYARSREAIEESDGRHLREATGVYQRYTVLRPDDQEAKLALVRLYNRTGYFLEASRNARDARPRDLADAAGADADMLFEEAVAMIGLGRLDDDFDDLVDALWTIGDENRAALLRMEGLARRGEPATAFTRTLLEGSPDDPRWLVLDGVARAPGADDDERLRIIDQVAGALGIDPATAEPVGPNPIEDPLIVREAVGALDRTGAYGLSIAALETATATIDDPDLERLLARRLLQAGDLERLTERFDWSGDALDDADTELVALAAAGRIGLEDADGAAPLIATLAARSEVDYRAKAWAPALELAADPASSTPAARVSALRACVEAYPGEPILGHMLAEALTGVAREDEAIEVWRRVLASQNAAGWLTPRVRLAEVLQRTGQHAEASMAARVALKVAPANGLANAIWYESLASLVASGVDVQLDMGEQIDRLRRARESVDGASGDDAGAIRDRLLLAHARLLCELGRTTEARRTIEGAIERHPRMTESTLHALTSVSRDHGLGIEERVQETARRAYGQTPGVGYVRAIELAADGRVDDGLDLIDRWARTDESHRKEWEVTRARFLDATGSVQQAVEAWAALSDAWPEDLDVQRLVLESASATSDRNLVELAAERYRALTNAREGDLSLTVALARAGAMLRDRPTRRDRDEAIALLQRAVSERQGSVRVRRLLARAYMLNDPSQEIRPDLAKAAEALEAAARLSPRDPSLAIELAQVLQDRREFNGARELLERLAADADLAPALRIEAARMLIDQGDGDVALRTLTSLGDDPAGDVPTIFKLARAYERLGDTPRATAQFERLASMDVAEPTILAVTGAALERAGQHEAALSVAARLEELAVEPGELDYFRGVWRERIGRADAAIESYRAALEADPEDVRSQIALVSVLLESDRPEEAMAVAERARAANPDDARLTVLYEQASLGVSDGQARDLGALIAAMRLDPDSAGLAEALDEIESLRESDGIDDPDALRTLVGRYEGTLPVQLFCAARMATLGGVYAEEAADIADRAMRAFPDSVEAARLTTEIELSLGRWREMLVAARAWSQRDQSRGAAPDLAIARAQLELGQAHAAVETLRPRFVPASKALESATDIGIVNIYARALVRDGKPDKALAAIEPLIERSGPVRTMVALPLSTSLFRSDEEIEAWIDRVRSAASPESVEEQLALAGAISSLAFAREDPDRSRLLGEALEVLHALVARDRATPVVLESIGKMHHALGELDAAAAAYRQAIAADPDRVDCRNNLAAILLEWGDDPDGAVEQATRAVDLAGSDAMGELDTLAQALVAKGERLAGGVDADLAPPVFAEAADVYGRMLAVAPARPALQWGLARSRQRAGDARGAVEAYEQLLQNPAIAPDLRGAAQNNLALALVRSAGGRADLDRAVALAEAASSGSEDPSFHETLGRACRASGDRAGAIGAYRRALSLRPDMAVAMIGLADVLRDGDDAERAEADELIARARALIEEGAAVDADSLALLESLSRPLSAVDD